MKLHPSSRGRALMLPAFGRGFSLIELMVAMTIGLLLLAGLFYIYFGAAQSSRLQGAVALMQTNVRYAFELMGMDIRMTGFTGSQDVNPSNIVNVAQTSHLCPLMDIFGNKNCDDGAGPLVGYENTNPPNVCTTANTTSCYRTNTDSLTVVRVDTENKYPLDSDASLSYPTALTTFTLDPWPASNAPQAGEIFVVADYIHAAAFQVGAANDPEVSFGAGGSPGNSGSLGTFGPSINALSLYRLSGVSYYIGTNPVGEPALYRDKLGHNAATVNTTAEELVQGVEDMEITYGVDTSTDLATRIGDGSVDGYWTATEVSDNTPNLQSAICTASVSARWKCVLSVRIKLTLVSAQNEKVGTTGDQLMRKTFTNTIAIRNRL